MKERKIIIDGFEYILPINSRVEGLIIETPKNISIILRPNNRLKSLLKEPSKNSQPSKTAHKVKKK